MALTDEQKQLAVSAGFIAIGTVVAGWGVAVVLDDTPPGPQWLGLFLIMFGLALAGNALAWLIWDNHRLRVLITVCVSLGIVALVVVIQDQIQSRNQQIEAKEEKISSLESQLEIEVTKTAQQQQTISDLQGSLDIVVTKTVNLEQTNSELESRLGAVLPDRYLRVVRLRTRTLVTLQSKRFPVHINEEVRIEVVNEDVESREFCWKVIPEEFSIFMKEVDPRGSDVTFVVPDALGKEISFHVNERDLTGTECLEEVWTGIARILPIAPVE